VSKFRTHLSHYIIYPPIRTLLYVSAAERGGMKSYEVSKFVAFSATVLKKRCVIVRDEKARIKESILTEIWSRYDTANEFGQLDYNFTKLETELKDKSTGDTLIYTMGFRASDLQKRAGLKGAANVDIAVIEEAEDIRDQDKYNTFVDSLRKEGCLIIVLLNTPDLGHFLIKRFFIAGPTDHDGYFQIRPKTIPGFYCIQTNYKDNPFLPAHIVSNYEGYGNPDHHLYNLHYYLTAILGYASTGRKGQIFTKVKPISLADYYQLRLTEYYGQDFGTASPAALVGVKFDGNTAYIRLINYKPMDVLSLAKLYSQLKFNDRDRIVCDYAEPETINRLKKGFKNLSFEDYEHYPLIAHGFYCVPCPSKDIQAGISLMSSMNLFVVEECADAWEEVSNYVYAQDKYGNYTDDPIDEYNHFWDACRYIITDQRRNKMFVR
jgi:phage terminase large subunit